MDNKKTSNSQFSLLEQRRFLPFFITQFLGALNDNVFRNGLIILVTFQGILVAGMNTSVLANVAGAVFILPFFLFSAIAGQLADKYEKSMLFRRIKMLEICLMCLATVCFWMEAWTLLLVILFLMGTQSTLFGPVKFAYLPQQLEPEELVGGNALVEAGTYSAIILGLLLGGLAVAVTPGETGVLIGCLLAISCCGYIASRSIPVTAPADPDLVIRWNLVKETAHILGYLRRDREILIAVIALSWFWFYGSAIMLQIPAYTQVILGGNESVTTALLVAFAVGVGAGSLACDRLSGHRIEIGLVPLGAIGLTLFSAAPYFAQPLPSDVAYETVSAFLADGGNLLILFYLAMVGAFGGMFSVPLYALIQHRAERQHLSRIIAANNVINSMFMVGASLLSIAVLSAGYSIPQLFLLLAILNVGFAIAMYTIRPRYLQRFVLWSLMRFVWRARINAITNIPARGTLLVYDRQHAHDTALICDAPGRPVLCVLTPQARLSWTERLVGWQPSRDNENRLSPDDFQAIDDALERGELVAVSAADPACGDLVERARSLAAAVVPAAVETRSRFSPYSVSFGHLLTRGNSEEQRLVAALRALRAD